MLHGMQYYDIVYNSKCNNQEAYRLWSEHTIIFTFFQGFLRLVQAPRVYPGGGFCIVAENMHENKSYSVHFKLDLHVFVLRNKKKKGFRLKAFE